MKILFAPIHYFFGKNFGSEMICAHDIFTRVSRLCLGSLAISLTKLDEQPGIPNLLYKYSIPKPFFPSILDNVKLIWHYTFRGLDLINNHGFTVIHHVFPFRIGRTFNPLFLFTGKRVKKVLGPVMVSVNFANTDLQKSSFFDTKDNLLVNRLVTLLDPLYAVLSKATLVRADHVVALNLIAKRELTSFGIPESKISIIPIGIDSQKFNFVPYQLKDEHRFHLLTLGYLTKRKGTELVIKALDIVVKKHSRVQLTVIGDGPQKSELEAQIKKLGLQKYVTLAGFVNFSQLEKYYHQSHLLVSMSRAESWGQVYIDSMACGIPVITSQNDGANEIVTDGKTGYIIKQEDYHALAQKVIYLIDHPHLIARFGLTARKEVEKKYDWDKAVIPQYLNLYKS